MVESAAKPSLETFESGRFTDCKARGAQALKRQSKPRGNAGTNKRNSERKCSGGEFVGKLLIRANQYFFST